MFTSLLKKKLFRYLFLSFFSITKGPLNVLGLIKKNIIESSLLLLNLKIYDSKGYKEPNRRPIVGITNMFTSLLKKKLFRYLFLSFFNLNKDPLIVLGLIKKNIIEYTFYRGSSALPRDRSHGSCLSC